MKKPGEDAPEKVPEGWKEFAAELREAVNSCLIEAVENGLDKEYTHKIGGYDFAVKVVRGASESDIGSRDSGDTMGELRFVGISDPGAMFQVTLDRAGTLVIDSLHAPYHDLVSPSAQERLQSFGPEDIEPVSSMDEEDVDLLNEKVPLNHLISGGEDAEVIKELQKDRKTIPQQKRDDFMKQHPILAYILKSDTVVVTKSPIHTAFAKKIDDILYRPAQ